ncbi:MAG: YraN family protein [Deferribacteres bacterium]|nr:YraN family protein [Deferribacteres bacterium]
MRLGERGEGLAAEFLKKKNYRIIRQNYRTPVGEIDIIAQDGPTLVFIEVKTRESLGYGQPFEAVNTFKMRRIAKAATLYLKRLRDIPPCRFDIVSVYYGRGRPEFELIRDAFEM